jgi:hypothetical protein
MWFARFRKVKKLEEDVEKLQNAVFWLVSRDKTLMKSGVDDLFIAKILDIEPKDIPWFQHGEVVSRTKHAPMHHTDGQKK